MSKFSTNYDRRHYNGGKPAKNRNAQSIGVCFCCGGTVYGTNEFCDTLCERARRGGRSRAEQFWKEYAENKVTPDLL